MVYTLGEAAKATGKSKSTISKAIKSGRMSAQKGATGIYAIDPSELHRVYPLTDSSEQDETHGIPPKKSENVSTIRELEAHLNAARERLADKEEVLADLREDRDRWRQQATSLLESKTPRRRWWQR